MTIITYEIAHNAVVDYLTGRWGFTKIHTGDDPAVEPDPPEAFARVSLINLRDGDWMEMGRTAGAAGRSVEYRATILVVVFTPTGGGDASAISYASQIEQIFSLSQIPAADSRLECGLAEISPPAPADEARRWRSTIVTVPVRYLSRAG